MWSLHIEATYTTQRTVKLALFNNPMHHFSPRAKTNNFHQIDLDANGVLTHGGKWHLFPIFLFFPLCALLCKLSGVFVTAWCWRKQQQAELWIANVPWGGRPWFDILNKLQIRQAGRSGTAYFFPFPQWDMGPSGNGNGESLDFSRKDQQRKASVCLHLHACVCLCLLVMVDWTIYCIGEGVRICARLA